MITVEKVVDFIINGIIFDVILDVYDDLYSESKLDDNLGNLVERGESYDLWEDDISIDYGTFGFLHLKQLSLQTKF